MKAKAEMTNARGLRGYSLPRVLLNMWWNPLKFLTSIAERYGDVVCVIPRRIYFVNHPDHVRRVLHDKRAIYSKSKVGATPKKEAPSKESTDIMPETYLERRKYLGFQSVVRSEGEAWHRQRSIMQPIFSRPQISTLSSVVSSATGSMLARWQNKTGSALDVEQEVLALVRRIVVKAFFGCNLESKEAETLASAAGHVHDYFDTRAFVPFRMPEKIPTATNRRFKESFKALSEFVDLELTKRDRNGHAGNDLLDLMLRARDDAGEGLNTRQLYDEALMLSIVGHQTTAAVIVWTLSQLSINSHVETKLYLELEHVLGERNPSLEDLPQLTYLRQVIEESLRLYPPTWIIPRRALEDDEIGGCPVPAGSDVVISPYVLHRHPGYWTDAESFDADRFVLGERHPAYIPFGYGERICMASNFALMQASLVLAQVVRAFHVEVALGHRVEPNRRARLVLQPRGGMPMTLHARRREVGKQTASIGRTA
jgi:cytochrome P450